MTDFLQQATGDSIITAEMAFRIAAAYPHAIPSHHELMDRWGMHRSTAYRWIRAMKEARGLLVDDTEGLDMTGTEVQCGNIKRLSPKFVADRAAFAIQAFKSPRAVCVDPTGRLSVECPASACEYDLMGVWAPDTGLKKLSAVLEDEIRAELQQRGWQNFVEQQRLKKAA